MFKPVDHVSWLQTQRCLPGFTFIWISKLVISTNTGWKLAGFDEYLSSQQEFWEGASASFEIFILLPRSQYFPQQYLNITFPVSSNLCSTL